MSVAVLPSARSYVGERTLRELRALRDVEIPQGVEKIGSEWFKNSGVESVTIPASVREIGAEAFRGCKQLRRVEFAEGSQLRRIGDRCFQGCS